jgi:DNA-binding MarR family transcriptional regulator
MQKRWKHLDRMIERDGPLGLPDSILTELAIRIDEAFTLKDYGQLEQLAEQLRAAYERAFAEAPDATVAAAKGDRSLHPSQHAALRVGQIGMAYLISSNAIERRVKEGFVETLTSATYAPYLTALSTAELTGVQLAEQLRRQPETVSRNLKRLRHIGAVDFRSDGTRQVNFLTPAGRQVANSLARRVSSSRPIAPQVQEWVSAATLRESPHMRQAPNFALARERVNLMELATSDG